MAIMTAEPGEVTEPTLPPPTHAEWMAIRDAQAKISSALEPLSTEMQARVLASAAIVTGTTERTVEILTGDA